MNYFELFDLPVAPVVDKSNLAKKFFELQRSNHPDFFTQATENEKEESLQLSAEVNKAFAIFNNKQLTIEYFLEINQQDTKNEKPILPPDFLMEMMEINEAITEGDKDINERIEAFGKQLDTGVEEVITRYREGTAAEADLITLKNYYYKKKYLNRILDRLGD